MGDLRRKSKRKTFYNAGIFTRGLEISVPNLAERKKEKLLIRGIVDNQLNYRECAGFNGREESFPKESRGDRTTIHGKRPRLGKLHG